MRIVFYFIDNDFIRKPFTRTEVMARIRAALRRRPDPKDLKEDLEGIFQVDDLKVEPTQLRVSRGGEDISLTPREVSILRVLSINAGKPMSRDFLLDHCWGIDYFPDSRTLDQHIYVLRRKIQKDPSRPKIILSVRGLGYRFPAG